MRPVSYLFRTLAVCVALGMAACGIKTAPDTPTPVRRVSGVITSEEMADLGSLTLYEVVQRLRPMWLRQSISHGAEIVVYQDATLFGGVESLRQLRPEMATRLRFLDAASASATLPGLSSRRVAAAIVVETR